MDRYYKRPHIVKHRRFRQLRKLIPKGCIIYNITQPNGDYLETKIINTGGMLICRKRTRNGINGTRRRYEKHLE